MPTTIVCPSCSEPFTRHGAPRSVDRCTTSGAVLDGRTREDEICIVCREGLDPVTLEPRAGGRKP